MEGIDEATKIVNESGNSFHCRVVRELKAKGWNVLVSPYYMDATTEKVREIDLIVEKGFPTYDHQGRVIGTVNVKLFVECKYIASENVFWFGDKDGASAEKLVRRATGMRANNTYTEKHHYMPGIIPRVAKLFASKTKPTSENEVIYKALNQSLSAMVALRNEASIIPRDDRSERVRRTVVLPVVLCNSFEKFYAVNMENESTPTRLEENFQIEVNYAYLDPDKNHHNEYFLLDAVDFTKLDAFLSIIEADVAAIAVAAP